MATLGEVRLKEMDMLYSMRAFNESKLLLTKDWKGLQFCMCPDAPVGAMLQCELCRDLFHSGCVPGPADPRGSQPWLCPLCRRSERPPLDRVLPLLASLQRLRVRLPEGDALRYLIERTVHWQHRVQQVSAALKLPEAQERISPSPCAKAFCSSSPSQEWNGSGQSQAAFYIEQRCIPLQGLSKELEQLMVEGLLLQVTLPETQKLYHVLLHRLSAQSADGTTQKHHAQGRSQAQNEDGHCSLKREAVSGTDRKAKRRLERDSVDGGGRCRAKKPQKKKIKLNKNKSRDSKAAPSSPSLTSDPSPSEDSEEDMALCPAEDCQQPEGDEVDWVQCDGSCNQWFHQVCVGVSPELAEKEDYICVSCTVKDGHVRK